MVIPPYNQYSNSNVSIAALQSLQKRWITKTTSLPIVSMVLKPVTESGGLPACLLFAISVSLMIKNSPQYQRTNTAEIRCSSGYFNNFDYIYMNINKYGLYYKFNINDETFSWTDFHNLYTYSNDFNLRTLLLHISFIFLTGNTIKVHKHKVLKITTSRHFFQYQVCRDSARFVGKEWRHAINGRAKNSEFWQFCFFSKFSSPEKPAK